MSETLKPCPFCGGEAEAVHEINGFWTVECTKCGALVDGIAAWNMRAADKPETYHDEFYDCESTIDKADPQGADGNLDQAQVDWLRFMPDGWDGTPPVVPGGRNGGGSDSREKLEEDVKMEYMEFLGDQQRIFAYLDRQAAITEREGREAWHKAASGEIYQAKQEADELRRKLDEQSCINALRETTLDYTERLGEAAKTLHIETRCTYDDLRVLCKTLMGVFE